jgi:hypothetical protein
MAEITRTMSEWITIDQRERRQRRELLRELAEYQKTHPPIMMSASRSRPKAVTAPPVPPKVDLRPPAELPANPTMNDIARQLGVTLEQLQQATGGMSLERLMQVLDVETAEQLVEQLNLVIGNTPKSLSRFERVRVAFAQVRQAGRRVGKLMAMSRDKAQRAEFIRKARAMRG